MTTNVDPIFEMYIYEAAQMIEQTEVIILDYEQSSYLDEPSINEIFRCMHTLKGSSAMMQFDGIAEVAHTLEDIIHFIREQATLQYNPVSLSNLILESIDYFKSDLANISHNGESLKNEHFISIKQHLTEFLEHIKQQPTDDIMSSAKETAYQLLITFSDDCQMENIRAYQLVHHLEQHIQIIEHTPADLIGDDTATSYIKEHGFTLHFFSSETYEQLLLLIEATAYIKTIELTKLETDSEILQENIVPQQPQNNIPKPVERTVNVNVAKTSVVSVNVQKLDKLMDLVGELVIAEAMVANTIRTLTEGNENSVSHMGQLRKITSDLQDTIMSIRMVPLSPVFHKMKRITRDMCQKLNKDASIDIIGEETEIDKSVIDQISDPLMHIVRNCIDHGIEDRETRLASGKSEVGKVTLEARNIGSDVLLIIKDDGRGINKDRILQKAFEAGLIHTEEAELSDREIYQYVFHPGLSTKDEITEFSGRGVGMDVVASNIEQIGGTIYIESEENKGTSFTRKIPLTLAIIDGMNVRVGDSHFTIPTTSIKESFRPAKKQIINDLSGQSMVMVRGEIYSIVNLGQYFSITPQFAEPDHAILLIVEHEDKSICIQVDELVGQQQVVIKPLPEYLRTFSDINRLSGCTLLGNGNISIILNINELIQHPY